MAESKPTTKNYRGENLTKEDLINKLLQLQRLGQTQGDQIDWESVVDDLIGNDPADWLDEEMTEVDELIKDGD